MNKDLIDLQKGCKSTCAIILDAPSKSLGPAIIMNAAIENEYLFSGRRNNPIFKEKLDMLSNGENITYFIIRNIDKLSIDMQNRYIALVKDREFLGYNLPTNVIIVFTVENELNLRNLSSELYHLSSVCF